MDRKTAQDLLACSIRPVLLASLDEAIAAGKAAKKNKASGQESLFGDEDDEGEERMLKMDAQIIATFWRACANAGEASAPPPIGRLKEGEITPEDEARFWGYHRKMARAGK
jgi:hypothetical protein